MEPILKVEDINVYYGSIHAIKGVSFEVNQGEIVTLIGANGAGKTTILAPAASWVRIWAGSPATRSSPRVWPWCRKAAGSFCR